MKKVLFIAIAILYSGILIAQNNPTPTVVFQEWEKVIESSDHTEISTRVVKCEISAFEQAHLLFFNESPDNKQVKFKVEITNKADGKNFSKEINFSAGKFQMVFTDCSNDPLFSNFKIDLPNDYTPGNLDIKITIL